MMIILLKNDHGHEMFNKMFKPFVVLYYVSYKICQTDRCSPKHFANKCVPLIYYE